MLTRRDTILSAAAAVFTTPALAAAPLRPTPAQTERPFYPDRMPPETDPDLVRMAGQVRQAGGEILALSGRVIGMDGRPVENAMVEIWQVDANGRYIHTADAQPGVSDPAFQGFGRTRVDASGRYAFRTIRPVAYSGRTPHIHFKIYRPSGRTLTTQLMFEGEALNQRDGVFRRLSPEVRNLSLGQLRRVGRDWATQWDIVLA